MPLRHRSLLTFQFLYFVTSSTFKHNPFPNQPDSLFTIKNILFRTSNEKNIELLAYVIMPNHIHFIVYSEKGGPGISSFMHSLKGRIREDLQGKGKFWQNRFDDVGITSEKQLKIKLDYIHFNPVRAGLVGDPEDWLFSSYGVLKDKRITALENLCANI
jgi:putative transposase